MLTMFDLDLDLFCVKVKFGHLGICMGKRPNSGLFSDSIVACDIKVGICKKLN